MPTFHRRIAFRVFIPAIVFVLTFGAIVFTSVSFVTTRFTEQQTESNLHWQADALRLIADSQADELLRSGRTANASAIRERKIISKTAIEDFARTNRVKIGVYDLNTRLMSEFGDLKAPITVPTMDMINRVQSFDVGEARYFSYTFSFAPWQWLVVLVRDSSEFDELERGLRRASWIAMVVLTVAAALLMLYITTIIRRPATHIIGDLEAQRSPSYRGITEFEYLSTSIASMLAVIQEKTAAVENYRDHLERLVDERTSQLHQALIEQGAVLANAQIGFAVVLDGRIVRCNRGMEQMGGYAEGELAGRPLRVLFPDDDAYRAFQDASEHLISAGRTYVGDVSYVRNDGTPYWCSVYAKALDPENPQLGTVLVDQDITPRKRAEQELALRSQSLQIALDHQHETQMQLIQQEKMASLGVLVAGVAHEINNPANFAHVGAQALSGEIEEFRRFLLELAGSDADAAVLATINRRIDELLAQLGTITEGTTRIKDLVLDLRTFSRLDQAAKKKVLIADSLTSTVNLVRTKYSQVAEIRCDLAVNPLLECFPAELNQVFMNLIVNACQAIQSKQEHSGDRTRGLVSIRSSIADDCLVLEFEDNGTGIPASAIEHIFEPFFTTKSVGDGTGLGLAISFGIIEKHAGKISVSTVEGVGTCFTISLPLHVHAESVQPA